MQVVKNTTIQQWNITLKSQQKNSEKQFSFNDYVLWSLKGNKSHLRRFIKKWFRPYIAQYVLPNNTMLLVTIEKFETNLMLVNVNEFKLYKYMEFEIQKQKQQMSMYWEQRVSGFQVEDYDMKVEDEDCVTKKPQIQGNEEK